MKKWHFSYPIQNRGNCYLIRFGMATFIVNTWSPRIDGLFSFGTPFLARTRISPGWVPGGICSVVNPSTVLTCYSCQNLHQWSCQIHAWGKGSKENMYQNKHGNHYTSIQSSWSSKIISILKAQTDIINYLVRKVQKHNKHVT